LQDEEAWNNIKGWTEAAGVAASMRNNRLGVLGHELIAKEIIKHFK
jgi:L-arabinose isomerase|tara:strand:- start:7825 stop:7962 length:138 start_codon:yes stop_codon:yes gene_type:complete